MLIPAKLTWLLQPLDTHVFVKVRLHLKQKFADSLISEPSETHRVVRMVRLVTGVIRKVLQGH
jgi:hypothetical protein